ncbi:MAG: DNA-binding protein WhiA [Clostridia bacterium]|nr:DNA-binding protein WhiA [Clostridia bacterium]
MSFSSSVKNELCRLDISQNCCMLSELASVIRISGTIKVNGNGEVNIRIVTENAAFARKLLTSIKKIHNIHPEVIARKSRKLKKHTSYILVITDSMGAKSLLSNIGISFKAGKLAESSDLKLEYSNLSDKLFKKVCCKKAFLRGAFLAGGSISDPEKTYHLEIANHSEELAHEACELMNRFSLNSKVIKRKGIYITYLKEGENIVDFLNIIGAHTSLLELENVRILKEMRNNVNRIVNCETANLEKTVNASLRQVENIRFIRDKIGLDNLPENLKEIAELRLIYSDANLKELGEMLNPPLGKSGVNHRLRKLDEIAESVRNLKGEL